MASRSLCRLLTKLFEARIPAEIVPIGIDPQQGRCQAGVTIGGPWEMLSKCWNAVSDSDGGTCIGLVEVYDLNDPAAAAELANISTRGLVETSDKALIGGVIIGPAGGPVATVIVRALGPSLANAVPPIAGFLADPQLTLYDPDESVVATNDNWQQNDPATIAEIQADGLTRTNVRESAILANLKAGNYTAIVSGVNGATGVGLVEIYHVPSSTITEQRTSDQNEDPLAATTVTSPMGNRSRRSALNLG
jgi:hypothetical protein